MGFRLALLLVSLSWAAAGCAAGSGSDDETDGDSDSDSDSDGDTDSDSDTDSDTDVDDCVDLDEDGFGEGPDCEGQIDCDDADIDIYPGANEACDRVDNSCDGAIDEGCDCIDGEPLPCGETDEGECLLGEQLCDGGMLGECLGEQGPSDEECNGLDDDCDGVEDDDIEEPELCAEQRGVCLGSVARCIGGDWADCDEQDYPAEYEAEEVSCDRLDNDCDGASDEDCDCADDDEQPCGTDEGICSVGIQTCVGGQWGSCEDGIGPEESERCDGDDNDCNGQPDDGIVGPPCELQDGVCRDSTQACEGGDFADCGAGRYGADYEVEETRCDGQDNDCDGGTDESCECTTNQQRACGSDIGACISGVQRCDAGHWGDCEDDVGPTEETCNGLDDDCDSQENEEPMSHPPCELQLGVCEGSVQRCQVDSWTACQAQDYGFRYEAEESWCDGMDNDCDGDRDEDCPPPEVVISEVYYDEPNVDGPRVFIELAGGGGEYLTECALEAINGANGAVYMTIDLDGQRLAPDGYFLIVDDAGNAAMRALADLVADADLQNGPDNLRLVCRDAVVDAVGYGAFDLDETFAGETAAAPDPAAGSSISRDATFTDTGDNSADFAAGVPSPRGRPEPELLIMLDWDTGSDVDLHLLRPDATFGGAPGDCYYANRAPDWGVAGTADDPRLLWDSMSFGPERIEFPSPPDGSYRIEVDYFSAGWAEALSATVTVYWQGALIETRLQELDEARRYWLVGSIDTATGAFTFDGRTSNDPL